MKNIYFLSDAHLGSRAIEHSRTHERRLVNFLESIKHDAAAVYMLGDMFDFWFEYRMVVPRGFTRFLGKCSELTDMGVEIHYFTGNHDIWCLDYLEKECGMKLHRTDETVEIYGNTFYLGHGDGLYTQTDWKYRLLSRMFHSSALRALFSMVHPRWAVDFGLNWARHSRLKRTDGLEPPYKGENEEEQVLFAKEYVRTHPDINFFIFGHRHIMLDLMLRRTTRILILGDWISNFSYAVFDGQHMFMERFLEGVTSPGRMD